MFKRLSKLFVMGTLVGCGAGKGSAPTGTVRGTQGIETKNVNELAEKINFKCGSANNDCPDSFGLILNGKNPRAENFHCSGFFVAKDLILTSSKCIKDAYIDSRDLCESNLAVKDIHNNTALCSEVVYKADEHSKLYKTDFALVRLDRELDVTPVSFNLAGFSEYRAYSFWSANKTYQNDNFELRKTQFCRRTKKNVVFPEGRSSNDKTVAFKNCKIDKGDLGAGLIDSNGAVTGLVWGSEKRTGEYDRFMSGKAGRSLMYSSPLSCIVNSFPELFPGYEIEDTVKEECEVQRSRNTIGQFFKTLTEIFLTKKQQVVSKVINISHRNRTSKSFYKIDHPECISNIYDDIEACEFYPSLYTSYEIRRKNIDRCYKTKRIKSRIEKTLFGDFDLDIYIDGNFYLTFTLPSCH